MKKTILLLIAAIILIIIIAYFSARLFVPEKRVRYETCVLLQNTKTKAVDCYGCANGVCKDAGLDWVVYQAPQAGIPYSCYKTAQGCQLAQ